MRTMAFTRSLALGCAAAGLIGLAASGAGAASLTVNAWTLGERVYVQSNSHTGWVNTAELDVTYDGRTGYSYCVDLAQSIGAGTSTGWDTRSADLDPSVLRAAWLIEFARPQFEAMLAPDSEEHAWGVTRATAIAGLQIAIWEVLGDAPGQYDLFSGEFSTVQGGASAGVMNLARSFLGALEARGLDEFETPAAWVYHANFQDQLVSSPIPEPSSLILFGAGASLVAFAAKRKRKVRVEGMAASNGVLPGVQAQEGPWWKSAQEANNPRNAVIPRDAHAFCPSDRHGAIGHPLACASDLHVRVLDRPAVPAARPMVG